jgi:hypothetical protein
LDPLEDHNDWVEHMYNPGYWVNRVSSFHIAGWRQTRRHAIREGLIAALISGLLAIALAYPAIELSQRTKVPVLRIMVDNLTIRPELFIVLVFLLSLALIFRGISDRRAARKRRDRRDAA